MNRNTVYPKDPQAKLMKQSSLESLFWDMPGFVFAKNADLSFIAASKSFVKSAGLRSLDQLLGKTDADMCWSDFADKYNQDDKQVLYESNISLIDPFIDKGGDLTYVSLTKKRVMFDDNSLALIGNGIFLESSDIQRKLHALNTADSKVFNNTMASYYLQSTFAGLSKQESKVLYYFLRGMTAKTIADALLLSKRTVESYIDNIKLKLNAYSKQDVFAVAFKRGWLTIVPDITYLNE